MSMDSSTHYVEFHSSDHGYSISTTATNTSERVREQKKLEYHTEYSTSPALSFLSFTIRRPPLAQWKHLTLYMLFRVCFLLYGLFFLVFGIVEFIQRFNDLFWMLHITMLVKMIVLRGALWSIKQRLEWQSSPEFLNLIDEAFPYGKSYFYITSVCNLIVMGFYYGVWFEEFFKGYLNVILATIFMFGTLAYTLFTVSVLIVSVTDAKQSASSVLTLIESSERGQITSEEYSTVHEEIRDSVKRGYYLNGTLLLTMLSNTVAAIVLLLKFRSITEDENTVHIVSFTVYVLVVQWATDVVFLYILLPEVASVNDLAQKLHVTLAHQRWVEGSLGASNRNTLEDVVSSVNGSSGGPSSGLSSMPLHVMEANRNDTLHRIIAQPIRYTIASIYFTRKVARNQLFGVVGAVLLSFLRVMVSLILE